jgi:hypothetical protein
VILQPVFTVSQSFDSRHEAEGVRRERLERLRLLERLERLELSRARIIHEITSEEQASPVAANGPVP